MIISEAQASAEAVPTVEQTVVEQEAPACPGIMGDLNKDGLVNNYDVEAIQKMIAGQDAPDLCGDLDGDSIIAPGDYAKLRLLIASGSQASEAGTASALPAADSGISGDANNDGKLDYKDVSLVKEMVAGIIPSNQNADVDGDGIVAPGDVAKIRLMAYQQSHKTENAPIATETEPTITSAEIETNETTNDTNQTVAENQTVGNSTDNPTVDASTRSNRFAKYTLV